MPSAMVNTAIAEPGASCRMHQGMLFIAGGNFRMGSDDHYPEEALRNWGGLAEAEFAWGSELCARSERIARAGSVRHILDVEGGLCDSDCAEIVGRCDAGKVHPRRREYRSTPGSDG